MDWARSLQQGYATLILRSLTLSIEMALVILRTTDKFVAFTEHLRTVPTISTGITRDIGFYRRSIKHLSIGWIQLPLHYMELLEPVCQDLTTLELDRCSLVSPNTELSPRQLITATVFSAYSHSQLLSRVTHLWLTVPQSHTSFVLPETLQYLALPLRAKSLSDMGRTLFQDVLALPNLKLLVINLIPKLHTLSVKLDTTPDLSPAEIWARITFEQGYERIIIRNSSKGYAEELSEFRSSGKSLWQTALREGLRHPDLQNAPAIDIPEP